MPLDERPAESGPREYGAELAPPDVEDPVVEAFKKDIDRTLLRENLRLTPAQRLAKFQDFMNAVERLRGAALPPDMRKRVLERDD